MPLAKISRLFVEMRRRHVFRVTGIYIVAAWVILQVADLAFESFGLPAVAMRFVWYALIAVSPLAVFWGWRYDITVDGVVRTPPVTGGESVDVKLDFLDCGPAIREPVRRFVEQIFVCWHARCLDHGARSRQRVQGHLTHVHPAIVERIVHSRDR
jgi:hypothetical protein